MASVRTNGIRPTFHSLTAWVILVALACAFLITLIHSGVDFAQGRKQLVQYQSDCAGVAPTPSKNPSGPCYYVSDYVSFQSPPADTGMTTADALFNDTKLSLTKVRMAGTYSNSNLPISGNQNVQVWRGQPAKIQIGKSWVVTSANPAYHTSLWALLAWLVATLAAWAVAIGIGLLLLRGLRASKTQEPGPLEAEPTFRMKAPV